MLEEDVLSSASTGTSAGALPAVQGMAVEDEEREIAESIQSTCPAYAELLEVVEHAVSRLELPWQCVRRETAQGRLDNRFLSGHKPQLWSAFHSFLACTLRSRGHGKPCI